MVGAKPLFGFVVVVVGRVLLVLSFQEERVEVRFLKERLLFFVLL
jgi:hypothetical protein